MAAVRSVFNVRVALTIALLWVPAVFSLVMRLIWRNTPSRIPTHWSGTGPADGFSDATTTWVICLIVAVGAAIAGIGVIILGQDVLAVRRSIAIGVFGAVAGIAAAAWPAFTLSEIAAHGLHGDQANTFVLFLAALAWGAIVFFAAGPFTGQGAELHTASSKTTAR